MNPGDRLLNNRYGDKNYLSPINSNDYILVLEHPDFGVRVANNEDGSINFIDPSGGPLIQVNSFSLDHKLLKSIKFEKGNGFILSF